MTWLDELTADVEATAADPSRLLEIRSKLPPIPEVPPVLLPPMPHAGGGLELLRMAWLSASERAGVKIFRAPFPEEMSAKTREILLECDAEMLQRGIAPHAWALFRVQSCMHYEAKITLRGVWNPEKVRDKKRVGHYSRWYSATFKGRRQASEHVRLTADYQALLEDAAKSVWRGTFDVGQLMARHFPAPNTLEVRHRSALAAVLIEQEDLAKRAKRGEWVW